MYGFFIYIRIYFLLAKLNVNEFGDVGEGIDVFVSEEFLELGEGEEITRKGEDDVGERDNDGDN